MNSNVAGPGTADTDRDDALHAPPTNLPAPPNRLIGREAELGAIAATLRHSRLVMLAGPGGSGKTRLAVDAGRAAAPLFRDGTWLIDLAHLNDPRLVPQAVAGVLQVRDQTGRSLMDVVIDSLRQRCTLLILDNCEHLLDACVMLARHLLDACPEIKLLATSREPLNIDGEAVYSVPPLELPDGERPFSAETAGAAPAVQLFSERAAARRAGPHFETTDISVIVEICRRLDGLPLAIELAAAWVDVLSVKQIASRLDDRFRLLVRGSRSAPPRQQTLRATIDWSYDLLDAPQQHLFRRLCAFAGGFDLAAAEAVGTCERLVPDAVLPALAALVEKSLVAVDLGAGDARYRVLESLRAYGRERLQAGHETARVMNVFAAYFRTSSQSLAARIYGAAQQETVREVASDLENYRAAMQWFMAEAQWDDYLTIAAAVWNYWDITGAANEAHYWLERGLKRALAGSVSPATRSRALGCLGQTIWREGDYPAAQTLQEQALAIAVAHGDAAGTMRAQLSLGGVHYAQAAYGAARECWEIALAMAREVDDTRQIAALLNNLALLADRDGDFDRATVLLTESVALRRAAGNRAGLATSLINLASIVGRGGDDLAVRANAGEALAIARGLGQRSHIAAALGELAQADYRTGEYEAAAVRTHEALALYREIGYRPGEAASLTMLGSIARTAGDLPGAADLQRQALTLCRELGDRPEIGRCLVSLAWLAFDGGKPAHAARLLGAVSAIIANGTLQPGVDSYEALLPLVSAALSREAFADAYQWGATEQLDTVVAAVLYAAGATHAMPLSAPARQRVISAASTSGAPRDVSTVIHLPPRQIDVLRLLAAGNSTKEIARTLHLSARTVERHIAEAYASIGARGRADAIRYALEHLAVVDSTLQQ